MLNNIALKSRLIKTSIKIDFDTKTKKYLIKKISNRATIEKSINSIIFCAANHFKRVTRLKLFNIKKKV